MFSIGPYRLQSRVLLAPMAGVSDAPFRAICQRMGAGLTTSEMLTADTSLWQSRKSSLRLRESELPFAGNAVDFSPSQNAESIPKSMQIAGCEPDMMANAARACVEAGAQIVDINMGCPAKKVCNKAAGSALLRDEALVKAILHAVVQAVDVPVTLKIRTGWCPASKNGVSIARLAEDAGINALTVHGRTRACRFGGEAEYDTIADIVERISIPVIANGDIDSPHKAATVLRKTGAQAVMVGRAAQGQPWLIRAIDQHLKLQPSIAPPSLAEVAKLVEEHLQALYQFYGEYQGLRIARKHIKWYLANLPSSTSTNSFDSSSFNKIEESAQQHAYVQAFFERLITKEDIAA